MFKHVKLMTVPIFAFLIVAIGIIMWNTREIPSCEPQCVSCEPEQCRKTFRQKYFHGG